METTGTLFFNQINKKKSYIRWVVIGLYAANVGISFMLAYQFAPILIFIENYYDVSEIGASFLVLVSSLVFLFTSIPAGYIVDNQGYLYSIKIGIVLQIGFSFLRIATESFYILLIAQIGIAASQPFILNAISKFVDNWFELDEVAIATGIGTIGLFVGTAIALITTPFLVESIGIRYSMVFYALFALLWGILFFLYCPLHRYSNTNDQNNIIKPFSWILVQNKHLLLLYFLSFLGLGIFNAIITFLEPILLQHSITSTESGVIGGLMILAGIIGTIFFSLLSDYIKQRRILLITCITGALIFLTPLCLSINYTYAITMSMLFGFFLLPAFSLLLDMCADITGYEYTGASTSILLLSGNVGAVIILLVIASAENDLVTIIIIFMILAGIGFIATFFTIETYTDRSKLNIGNSVNAMIHDHGLLGHPS